MTFGERFVKYRTSSAFPKLLALTCGTWLTWNLIPWLPHFDGPDMGRLTLILSVEASLAASFILEDGARQTGLLLNVLKRIEGEVEVIELAARRKQAETLEEGLTNAA